MVFCRVSQAFDVTASCFCGSSHMATAGQLPHTGLESPAHACYTYAYIHRYTCIYIYTSTYVHAYINIHRCVSIYIYICAYMSRIHIYIYVCT